MAVPRTVPAMRGHAKLPPRLPLSQPPLTQWGQQRGKRVLADAAYDTRDNFAFLRERGIDAAIPVRAGASRKSLGKGLARSLAVGERRRVGETGWRLRHQYRMRWKVETTFSAVKRVIGKSVMSRRRDIMLREAEQTFAAYNQLMGV